MATNVRVTRHCAVSNDDLLTAMVDMLRRYAPRVATVLDPFAGTGRIVRHLGDAGYGTYGIELEPEWAALDYYVFQGDALDLPYEDNNFDAIVTSPTYGNRMADKDMRASVAGTYAKSLGRIASDGSSCHLQWGDTYRDFHRAAWHEATRVLRPGGWFLLNMKDHYRAKTLQRVTDWHVETLRAMRFTHVATREVPTPSLRHGANAELRVSYESLILLQLDA